jgi:hypothetical protein
MYLEWGVEAYQPIILERDTCQIPKYRTSEESLLVPGENLRQTVSCALRNSDCSCDLQQP